MRLRSFFTCKKTNAIGMSPGFTLVQLSMLLVIFGVVIAASLPSTNESSSVARGQKTKERFVAIEKATKAFMTMYGRRPCPADASLGVAAANFGIEAATEGTCTGGTPASNFSGTGADANIVAGGVPTAALGLPAEYALDGFGRRITYVVDKRATAKGTCNALQGGDVAQSSYVGDIDIYDTTTSGALTAETMWALISHGQNAHGAFPAEGSSVADRLKTGNTDNDTLTNASVNSSFTTAFDRIFVRKEPTATFDDAVWYAEDTKNVCCVGKVCQTLGFRVTHSAANGAITLKPSADLNQDGIDDMIFYQSSTFTTTLYGRSVVWPALVDLNTDINGTLGRQMLGGADCGCAMASGADMNNDGIGDLIGTDGGAGIGYYIRVLYGVAGTGTTTTNSTSLDGTNGFRFLMNNTPLQNLNGFATGDFNNDNKTDIAISNYTHNSDGSGNSGRVWVVYGRDTWTSTVDVNAMADGVNGFVIDYVAGDGQLGAYGSLGAGDFNGDSVDDLVIPAPDANHSCVQCGSTYVIFGGGTYAASATAASYADGTKGTRIDGVAGSMDFITTGYIINSVRYPDLNGDGIDDIVLLTNRIPSTTELGHIAVVYGKASWSATFSLGSLDGTNGFALNPEATEADSTHATDIAGFADVNQDGYNDILLVSPAADWNGTDTGAAYLIFGKATAWPASSSIKDYMDGINGVRLLAASTASKGISSASLGDYNNDGIPDIALSAGYSGNASEDFYVVYGVSDLSAWSSGFILSDID